MKETKLVHFIKAQHSNVHDILLYLYYPGMSWHVISELSSSPDPSSGVVSSRVWVPVPVMTLVPLSYALDLNCFVKEFGRSAFYSASHAPSG